MSKIPFTDLPLSKEVQKAISEMGFEEATPIQSEAIPLILEGHDVTGQSRTGTGKTIAFAVPAVELVEAGKAFTQALILCPTRELCIQVAEEVNKLAKHKKGVHPLPVYGGQPYERQLQGMRRGAQIVIGTPGRLIDHLNRGSLKLDGVKLVVLDEADEMLDMGFQEDLETILKAMPEEKQTVLFSATIPPGIRHLIKKYQNDPKTIRITQEALTVPQTVQHYIEVRNHMKLEALCRCLDVHNVKLGIVFCNTRLRVDELVGQLQARGYSSDGLHGDVKQTQRDRVMGRFRTGQIEILVATDVASRGIDVKNVEAVFNYDLPKDEEDYVHRIGRTGRAGQEGLAISFITGKEAYKLREIQKFMKAKVERKPIPSLDDVESAQYALLLEKVRETMRSGTSKKVSVMVERLMEDEFTAVDVASALLQMSLPKVPERTGKDEGTDYLGGFPTVKIFLNIGRTHGARPKDVLGALAGETGLPGKIFGAIEVGSKHSLAEVPVDSMDEILAKMKGVRIKGVPIKARKAEF